MEGNSRSKGKEEEEQLEVSCSKSLSNREELATAHSSRESQDAYLEDVPLLVKEEKTMLREEQDRSGRNSVEEEISSSSSTDLSNKKEVSSNINSRGHKRTPLPQSNS